MEVKVEPLRCQREVLANLINDYWEKARHARERGQGIAWCTSLACPEIVVAMDLFPIFPENHAAMCGTRQVSADLCAVAEANDFSPDLCSYAKNDLGSLLSGRETKSPIGGLPKPDVLLVSNNQCTTVVKWFEHLSRYFDVPMILIDAPQFHDGASEGEIERGTSYVRDQLREATDFLAEFTGRPFDWDRLQEGVGLTAEAARLFTEAIRLARNVPAPLTSFDHFISLFPMVCLRGFPEGVEYYRLFKEQVAERVNQGIGAVPNERYRLYWDNIPIWYRVGAHARKFASYGAAVVASVYPYGTWCLPVGDMEASKPLESLAKAMTRTYICYGTKFRTEFIADLVKEFSVDGLVMQASRTCKPFLIGQQDIVKGVEERTGVPGVIVEGDMVDARLFSDSQFDDRIEAFMEVLAKRTSRRATGN